jgi:hypothetical protein
MPGYVDGSLWFPAMGVPVVINEFAQLSPCMDPHAVDCHARGEGRKAGSVTGNMSKADTQYVDDALAIEDEYESELAAVQVGLTRFEVAPHEYAARRAEIAARAYLKLAEAHKRFIGRNN